MLSVLGILSVQVMAPKSTTVQEVVQETGNGVTEKTKFKADIVWPNVVVFAMLHAAAIYGTYLILFRADWRTLVFAVFLGSIAGLSITAGAHRLWTHRAYKARLPLRIFLVFLNFVACQNDIYEWCRDHRVHHKFSETDADPHNVKRGFFFAHCGWLMMKKHPDVATKGKTVDLSDVLADPVIRFQRWFYVPLTALVGFVMPSVVPTLWGETVWNGFFIATAFRYIVSLHLTWLVNSAAHMWGNRPYDLSIHAAENILVSMGALGEGWHNYHHAFPWDYATSELGWRVNVTTMFIDLMAKLGLAYDLRRATSNMVHQRKLRTGALTTGCIAEEEKEH